ncbi:MAG: ribose 5-phosphate isomerase B [Deltaproteobacteria bacterium]|jgi:ribose 5-phosphate isomerase B|nr:ribose 5-phosphate isomerase B [Deltaproteobacteria bacterium]MBK8720090.1 ribose 5-phosphate isomerase B [Deltaproteobacteria bacterium]MBP7292257.1 ribose 5-phosphate isomerase B [Nannocystaceae bacterium]
MRLHFASDHGAVALRRDLVEAARGDGHEIASELGPDDPSRSVDYPEIAQQLCERVLADAGSLGVLCCGTGQGVAMAANRIAGIRAAVLSDAFSAEMARAHNDANVLCMGGRVIGLGLGRTLLRTFLATPFEGGRHARRVALLEQLSRR